MAGSISLSLSQQFDAQGKPLSGGKLYFFQAGTSTPQNSYQDVALSLVNANPITLDASGRVPAFYLADGQIKIRLADQAGVTILAVDNLLVIGPSSGAGSPPTVDATTILATGDVKARYGTGTLVGWVRLNGRTIGSATSGATERANADTQALFEFLWTVDANLAVSGGRGASANADWTANKTITLPDGRGRVLAALDDMGGAAAGRLTAGFFGTAATVLGAVGGVESNTLTIPQLPTVTPAGSISLGFVDPQHVHQEFRHDLGASGGGGNALLDTGPGGAAVRNTNAAPTGITFNPTFTGTPFGSGNAHNNTQPTILVTYYIKL
jgi:microcystin-dependent protein